ncbi:MAG: hypothetical protein JOZ41_14365 [Chloroflexi bacterium]|nr:hypothetical protein [Chloroflexota bacterium]
MSETMHGGRRRLTDEERRQALAALEGAHRLQVELRARYGTMGPRSEELLNEARDERWAQRERADEP